MSNEKSSVIINIKDIIGDIGNSYDINYISYFKTQINIKPAIRELKNQTNINLSMFYIQPLIKNNKTVNKYLAYIYHNNKDLYFIYDTNANTKLYDIGDLTTNKIKKLFNNNLTQINRNLKTINSENIPSSPSSSSSSPSI